METHYRCKANKAHTFTKDSIKEVVICPTCHNFADKIKEQSHDDSFNTIITAAAVDAIEDTMDYSSTDVSVDAPSSNTNDFSGGGGKMEGAGSSGEW